jgi:hypothetical protein
MKNLYSIVLEVQGYSSLLGVTIFPNRRRKVTDFL